MKRNKTNIKSLARGLAARLGALCALGAALSSCSMIDEDLPECPQGLSLRFVYDYNMERANAFHSQVDCITLYIFDSNGSFLEKRTESSEALQDETYRMNLDDLAPGTYNFVALGGGACDQNSFHITEFETRHRTGLQMRLPLDENRHSSDKLHDLFYGEVTGVKMVKNERHEATLYLMKDTNSVQIALQEVEAPYSVDVNDYEFYLEADNELLDYDNTTVSTGGMGYNPHTLENRIAGYAGFSGSSLEYDESQTVQVAVSEFHMSRLMTQNSDNSYIVIKSKESGAEVIRVPLIEYMALSRHSSYSWIESDQEYLDRQSTWNFMFFLQKGRWIQNRVAINNWIVRFNHAEV